MTRQLRLHLLIAYLAMILSGCGGGGGYARPGYAHPHGVQGRPAHSYGKARSIPCESEHDRITYCSAGMSIGRVEIGKRLSKSPCEQDRSWGYDRKRLWVDHGCRARFRVYPGAGGAGSSGGSDEKVIRCESEKNRHHRCDAGFRIERAVIEHQFSQSRCDKGRSWGTDNRGVWVNQGCRAEFRVYGR